MDQFASTRKYTDRMSNIGGRRVELNRINTTNKQILDRLNKTTAYYDNSNAAKDWKVFRKHLEHMGKYAYKGGGKLNGSVQQILKKGLPKANDSRTRRAATASGRRRIHTPQRGSNLSAQVRDSMHNQKNKKMKKKTKKKRKRLRPLTSPIKMPSTHSLKAN